MGREVGHPRAVLPVESPRADAGLRDEHSGLTRGEGDKALFLLLDALRAGHLDRAVHQSGHGVGFVVELAPGHPGSAPGQQGCCLLRS